MSNEELLAELKHTVKEYADLLCETSYRNDHILAVADKKSRIDEIFNLFAENDKKVDSHSE